MSGITSFLHSLNLIKQIPIFAKLNWFEQQKIARKSVIVEYKKGETVRRVGDPADYFYCLITGRLQAFTLNNERIKENVEFIHRGMHFGIISVFTGETHSLTFEAINDSIILKIAKADFHSILKSIPTLGLEFSQSLSQRVRSHREGQKSIFESTIISIYSPVIGTGSSTYAMNFALSLQIETNKKVMLLNIHTAQNLDDKSESTKDKPVPKWKKPPIELKDIVGDHDKIFDSIIKEELAIDLLNVMFDASDSDLKKQISPLVSTLVGDYHYVIVDLPNDMDDFVLQTLTQSDYVHLLSLDRKKDLEQMRSVIDRLELTFKERFNEDRLRVIIRGIHDQVYLSFEDISKVIDFKVDHVIPHIHADQLKEDIHSSSVTVYRSDENSEYNKVLRRIARQVGGVMVGVVLGGGAALGIAHVGVIRVLEEENIPVDMVVGSSMGALIGALWATGKNAKELEEIAREFEKKGNMLKLFDPPLFPISGLIKGNAIKRWLAKHLGTKTFYSCDIPFKVVSYDLIRREELILERGSLVDAVRESIAIPGVLKPVLTQDRVIIDGGVLNPLPTNVLAGRGIKKIIAINVLQSPDEVSQGHDLHQRREEEKLSRSFLKAPLSYISHRIMRTLAKPFKPNISDILVRTLQASEYVIAEQSAQQADVLIHPDLVGIDWFELYRVDDLIRKGEEATRALIPDIKALVKK